MSYYRVRELLDQAWDAKKEESYSLAQRYYNAVLDIDPSNWEAKMFLSIVDKMQITCSESDWAIRAVRNSLSNVAEIIANNVYDEKLRDFYCFDIAVTATRFALYICDLQHEEMENLLQLRALNRWTLGRFSKEHAKPRYKALSTMLYELADDLKKQFPNGEGIDGSNMAKDVARTICKLA